TMQNAGGIFMQNGADGIRVRAADAPAVRPGDRIEAVGFPTPGNFSTILDDAVVRVNGHGPPPAPREMRAGAVLDRTAHAPAAPGAVLLRVQGRVLEAVRSAE